VLHDHLEELDKSFLPLDAFLTVFCLQLGNGVFLGYGGNYAARMLQLKQLVEFNKLFISSSDLNGFNLSLQGAINDVLPESEYNAIRNQI